MNAEAQQRESVRPIASSISHASQVLGSSRESVLPPGEHPGETRFIYALVVGCSPNRYLTCRVWLLYSGTCDDFKASASCNDSRAYGIAVSACVGKTSCSITPSAFCSWTDSTGSNPRCPFANHDPCLGKSKHLAVQATGCKPLPKSPPPPPPPPPAPGTIAPLTAASGEVHTVYGAVSVAWSDTGGSGPASPVHMAISIPIGFDNTTVWIVGTSDTVTESGKPATAAEGVQFVEEAMRQGEPYSVWTVGSGRYTFSSHRQ